MGSSAAFVERLKGGDDLFRNVSRGLQRFDETCTWQVRAPCMNPTSIHGVFNHISCKTTSHSQTHALAFISHIDQYAYSVHALVSTACSSAARRHSLPTRCADDAGTRSQHKLRKYVHSSFRAADRSVRTSAGPPDSRS